MSFSLAELKATTRQAVQDAMAYDGQYSDDTLAEPVDVRVRCHNKLVRQSSMPGEGMSEILASVDRLLFSRADLDNAGLTLVQGGTVTVADWGDATFQLDVRDAYDGPVTETWTVVRLS